MRVKQTARKSTATHQTSRTDPVRGQISSLLLSAKRKSLTPSNIRNPQPSGSRGIITGKGKGKSKGKFLEYQPVKVKPRARSGELALREIKRLREGYELLIPRAAFHRLVREITQEQSTEYRYQVAALEALQEATEAFLVQTYEDAYLLTLHAKRVTLFPSDMQLLRRLFRAT